jgi:hypothetical protein
MVVHRNRETIAMNTLKWLGSVSIVGFLATACASQPPAKAPGSNPADMTLEGHRSAADAEQALADWNRAEASKIVESKAVTQFELRRPYLLEAQKHEDFARQHAQAAALVAASGR